MNLFHKDTNTVMYWQWTNTYSSEFAICHVVRHGNMNSI